MRHTTLLLTLAASLALVAASPAKRPQLDPFARVSAYGDTTFGEGVVQSQSYGEGVYRVEFSRSVLRCSILASLTYAEPGTEITVGILTPDVTAVYVSVTRNGEPRDTTFDLVLRCAR